MKNKHIKHLIISETESLYLVYSKVSHGVTAPQKHIYDFNQYISKISSQIHEAQAFLRF